MLADGILNEAIRTAAHILMNADVAFKAFQITTRVPTYFHFFSHSVYTLIVIRLHRPLAVVHLGYHLFSQPFALLMPVLYHSHFVVAFALCQFYESFKVFVP